MIPKPLSQVSLADLQAMIGTMREGKTVEFKRSMPAKTNEEIVKFLRAITSLANTGGGDLLIGIDAAKGLANAIPGVPGDSLDGEKLRLSQLLAAHVEPPLPRIDDHSVDCGQNQHVLIFRVHRSWLAPHRVKIDNKFYGRNSAGTYPLDVAELRTAFTLSDTVTDRIRKFRTDRLIKIAAGETPVRLDGMANMVIHVLPLSTFAEGKHLDIVETIGRGHVMPLPPGRVFQQNSHMLNLDGLVTYMRHPNEPTRAYAQVFRTGAVEGVDNLSPHQTTGKPLLIAANFENTIVSTLKNYLLFLRDIELPPPIFIFISFCGVQGCCLRYASEMGIGYHEAGPLTDDVIALPEIMIDTDAPDIPASMKLTFNTIWNAFGLLGSRLYNAQGAWIGTA